jgi:hypothetical protein
MNNKRYIWTSVLILLILTISGCRTTIEVQTSGQPTQPPEPGSIPAMEAPYSGWASYVNPDYGFAFRYPVTWALEEDANLVKLSRGKFLLAIAFQRQSEDAHPPWTGMPAGSFESRGKVAFLGQESEMHSLVYEGKTKVLTYGAQVSDVLYAIRLDDMTTADYQSIEIPEALQDEVGRIVGSFFLPESGGL